MFARAEEWGIGERQMRLLYWVWVCGFSCISLSILHSRLFSYFGLLYGISNCIFMFIPVFLRCCVSSATYQTEPDSHITTSGSYRYHELSLYVVISCSFTATSLLV